MSWLVFDMKRHKANQLAYEFGQNAYLWIERGKSVKLLYAC
ncbi:hypothetical protein [Aliikangiella sp. IMCC44359]